MSFFDRFKTARPSSETAAEPAVTFESGVLVEETPVEAPSMSQIAPAETVGAESTSEASLADSPAVEIAPSVDFESEFASIVPEEGASPVTETQEEFAISGHTEVPSHSETEADLEEWSEPLASPAPPILEADTILITPTGTLVIEDWIETRGGEQIYRARLNGEENGEMKREVRLRAATGLAGERLAREAMWRAHWEATARLAMLPVFVTHFKEGETTFLATETTAIGPTLAEFFAEHEAREERNEASFLSETLLILTQLAAFLVRLHGAGFAHLGLRPDSLFLGKPVQVLDCSFAAPIGESLEAPLSLAGYSAPELARPGNVDARSDIYAVGALFYRALTGADVPETGADFPTWTPRVALAGAPQLLRRCLGETPTRFNSAEELHRALVKLKNRLRPSTTYVLDGASTIGLEGTRATNQDAFGFVSGAWESESGPVSWAAFCVADGMGGMAAGEVASEAAVGAFLSAAALWSAEAKASALAPLAATVQEQLIKEWASGANEAVVRAMAERGVRGGCTLDAALVIERRLCLAHVGDGRFYLLRGDEWQLLSRDHSFVMSLLLQGEISFDDIRTHAERNKVTRSLGERHPQPDYFVDSLQVTQNAPALELEVGDVLLACSDGVWEPVMEAEMLNAVKKGELPAASRAILKLALQRGAPDNATLVLMRLDEHPAPVFA